jgi:hypothetical protein
MLRHYAEIRTSGYTCSAFGRSRVLITFAIFNTPGVCALSVYAVTLQSPWG